MVSTLYSHASCHEFKFRLNLNFCSLFFCWLSCCNRSCTRNVRPYNYFFSVSVSTPTSSKRVLALSFLWKSWSKRVLCSLLSLKLYCIWNNGSAYYDAVMICVCQKWTSKPVLKQKQKWTVVFLSIFVIIWSFCYNYFYSHTHQSHTHTHIVQELLMSTAASHDGS